MFSLGLTQVSVLLSDSDNFNPCLLQQAFQGEPKEIAKEKTPPLDINLEIVVIESIDRSHEQVREAKGKGKRLMFQEKETQVSQPKRPRTRSELKKMAEQT